MRVSEPYTIFPRTMKSGKVVYYYQFRLDNGTRSTPKSTGCTTESSAKRYCNKLYNQGTFKLHSSLRFEIFTKDFFSKDKEFYKWKKINNSKITDSTLLAYDKFLRMQLIPYFKDYQLSAITRSEVKNWIIWASSNWSPKTVNNAQTVLNTIMNQAVDKGIIDFNPASNLCFRKVDKKERILMTIDELNKTYYSDKWSNENIRLAFLVASITGMRIGEVIALRNEDISDNYINVRHSYSQYFGLGTTKTKECRYVPKPKELVLHNDNSEWIFEDKKTGKPFNCCRMYDNLMRIWKSIGIDAKERGLTTHTLRHFFNSYLLGQNVPKAKVKAVMGHKDEDMTDWYTHWTPDMFPEVYDKQLELFKEIICREK